MSTKKDMTAIVPKRDYSDIATFQNPDVVEAFIQEPAMVVLEVLTGLMAGGIKGALVTGGKLAQGAFKARLYQQFAIELSKLRDEGKIEDDFVEKKYGYKTWVDLFKIIDEESPDEDRLEALKAMFFDVNRANATDGERIVAYQLWQITKTLTSGDLLVLKATYQILPGWGAGHSSYAHWKNAIAQNCGGIPTAMVDLYEKHLTESLLLTPRQHGDGSGILQTNARLTDLAIRLCKNIETYNAAISED